MSVSTFLYWCLCIKKTSADFVFLVCAGVAMISTVYPFIVISVNQEMVALLVVQIVALAITIGCLVSATLKQFQTG